MWSGGRFAEADSVAETAAEAVAVAVAVATADSEALAVADPGWDGGDDFHASTTANAAAIATTPTSGRSHFLLEPSRGTPGISTGA